MEKKKLKKEEREKTKKALRTKHKEKYIIIFVSVLVAVTAIWCFGLLVQSCYFSEAEGVFTTLTTLFSAYAFAGVIVTIFMQREELELQRDEMELTRDELIKQNKTLSRQRFENTFFQLLQKQSEITRSIKLREYQTVFGFETFKFIYGKLQAETKEIKRRKLGNLGASQPYVIDEKIAQMPTELVTAISEFAKILKPLENDLLHYYRHLVVTIRFVVEMKVNIKKQRYVDFIKAELSQYEVLFLFYYGLSDYGLKEVKPLLKEINIFKDLNKNLLIDQDHINEYEKD